MVHFIQTTYVSNKSLHLRTVRVCIIVKPLQFRTKPGLLCSAFWIKTSFFLRIGSWSLLITEVIGLKLNVVVSMFSETDFFSTNETTHTTLTNTNFSEVSRSTSITNFKHKFQERLRTIQTHKGEKEIEYWVPIHLRKRVKHKQTIIYIDKHSTNTYKQCLSP